MSCTLQEGDVFRDDVDSNVFDPNMSNRRGTISAIGGERQRRTSQARKLKVKIKQNNFLERSLFFERLNVA